MKYLLAFLQFLGWTASWWLYLIGTLVYAILLTKKDDQSNAWWFETLYACYNWLMNASLEVQDFITDKGELPTTLEFPWNRN